MNAKVHTILTQSLQIFREYGIKSVSMDDLSSSMKISKKTLYKYFKNKEHLLEILFLEFSPLLFDDYSIASYKKHENAIDFLFDIQAFIVAQKSLLTPAITYDLQTTYPHIYIAMQEKVIEQAQNLITKNITLGQAQNIYKKDIDINIASYIFSQLSTLIENPKEQSFTSENLLNEILKIFLYRIANPEGVRQFEMIEKQRV
ncbi:MAG: TetR/AcrR family transcriptional regulator [Bacteroidales bacterium]|nr:TetR/AcrR family transcriptional regulator [Bacteroidales bacterium]NLK80781.1 TetR/AcrR family transcriptional regulator [Bacteroidales bacterium]